MQLSLTLLSVLSVLSAAVFYRAGVDFIDTLSPQGCRMSWMSPSYTLRADFDHRWSSLASRYSLYLYREVGWETASQLHGAPVLFIPGNAGSSHQVRSIASSATRQYFSSPYSISPQFSEGTYKPLDFFALEFNEDLSAFHGPTVDAEARYARAAIEYILSLYPANTSITLLGHSMGGVVATALLPLPQVAALITMSTPHTLPPARLDRRVDAIFTANQQILSTVNSPILSICGGATDLMVPSESCILPDISTDSEARPYRRTIFTSALEGAWTGVGHQAMVWCHQVRWRVARAALELASLSQPTSVQRGEVLDRWLRDGHTLPALLSRDTGIPPVDPQESESEYLDSSVSLILREPFLKNLRTYFIPTPSAPSTQFVLYLSRGSIAPISPHVPLPLHVSVYKCQNSVLDNTCVSLPPKVLQMIPEPIPGKSFPVSDEGTDESEGVVVFVADVEMRASGLGNGDHNAADPGYIAVRVEGADGRGWLAAGFTQHEEIISNVEPIGLVLPKSSVKITLPSDTMRAQISFPNLLSSSLLVYNLVASFKNPETCAGSLLSPLLQHISHPSETHYFPLLSTLTSPSHKILLHSHASGPFLPAYRRGFNLTIFSSHDRDCAVESVTLSINWWGTLGRWGVRYAQAALAWGIGIYALVLYHAWSVHSGTTNAGMVFLGVQQSLVGFVRNALLKLVALSVIVSILPLSHELWLGTGGEGIFVAIAPILAVIVTGLLCAVCGFVSVVVSMASWFRRKIIRSRREEASYRRGALLSMALVLVLIFVFVPWQVAFLCAWVYHLSTCILQHASTGAPPPQTRVIPLVPRAHSSQASPMRDSSPSPSSPSPSPGESPASIGRSISLYNQNFHLLMLMTWLLPIVAPVLAVWVRTIAASGIHAVWGAASGWGTDKNILLVAPWLIVVEWAGNGGDVFTSLSSRRRQLSAYGLVVLALVAFFMGPRATYVVFEVTSAAIGIIVILNIGPKYWAQRS